MGRIVPTYYDSGRKTIGSVLVTVRELDHFGTHDVTSPTKVIGTGSDYGSALRNFVTNLDEYISILTKFRDEILKTSRAYKEAIEVDYSGYPVARKIPAPKNADGAHFYMEYK